MATTEATARTDHRLGFPSQDEETAVDRLPVTGELPAWLTGSLVRVTPALLEVGGRRARPLVRRAGDAQPLRLRGRPVSYASRFLESRAYQDAKDGEWRHGGFATDPCRSIFKRVQQVFSPDTTDNPNVNLARIGERYIAMTETPMPVEFDPETLETVGRLEYADKLKAHVTTAHPHHDPERDELVNYVGALLARERVRALRPAGRQLGAARDRAHAREGAGLHARVRDERALPDPRRVPAAREPAEARVLRQAVHRELHLAAGDEGTRFQVFDRATGELRGTYETDAFFCFHHVNAFERGGELVIDLCAYEDSSVIDSLYLDDDGPKGTLPPVELRRYTIDLDGGAVRCGAARRGHARAAADRLRAPQHARLLVRVLHRGGRGAGSTGS